MLLNKAVQERNIPDEECFLFIYFFSWGETESTWYCGRCVLLYQPQMIDDDDECGAVGGIRICGGKSKYS
jgi:hypothetical protein